MPLQRPKLFTDYNGVEVLIDGSGEFNAYVDGIMLRDPTYAGLVQKIETEKKASAKAVKLDLPVYVLLQHGNDNDTVYGLEERRLIGLNRSDSSFKFNEPIAGNLLVMVPKSEKTQEAIERLKDAMTMQHQAEMDLAGHRIKPNYYGGRIDASDYEKHVVGLSYRYQQAAKGEGE